RADVVIGLIANHPYARRASERGDFWYLTSECLGSGYVMPLPLLRLFLDWRASIPEHRRKHTNEDFLITSWIHMTSRRCWHPIPGPIDHRRDIQSTNPSDTYPFRRSYVRWDDKAVAGRRLVDADTWLVGREPLDFGFDAS